MNDDFDYANKYIKEWDDTTERGLSLAESMELIPELKKIPEFDATRYGNSSEDMFEKVAKYCDTIGLKAERNNIIDKYDVDFVIRKKGSNEIIAYMDLEQDNIGSFEDDGSFKWRELTIPAEKEKHFYRDKPFYYIKFSRDFLWCYVLDGWACRDEIRRGPRTRNMCGTIVDRDMLYIRSSSVFTRKNPKGIHRLMIKNWLHAVRVLYNHNHSQKSLEGF